MDNNQKTTKVCFATSVIDFLSLSLSRPLNRTILATSEDMISALGPRETESLVEFAKKEGKGLNLMRPSGFFFALQEEGGRGHLNSPA
jgi:hypothetical protein